MMSEAGRLSCEESFRRMDTLVDREATPEELAWADRHFAECPACAAERSFELAVLTTIRARLREIAVPTDLKDRILGAIRLEALLDDDLTF